MSDTKDLLNAIISGNNVDAERIFQDNMDLDELETN